MTHDEIRSTFAQAVENVKVLFTEYPVVIEYDNRMIVNVDNQTNPFLCVETKIVGGRQADLSANPIRRYVGFFILTAKARLGEGTRKQTELLEFFYTRLDKRKIGPSIIEMADFDGVVRKSGNWTGISALLPFRADRID